MVVHSVHETPKKLIANNQYAVRLLIVLIFLFGLLLYAVDITSLFLPQTLKFHFPLIGNAPQEDLWNWDFVNEYAESVREHHKSYFVNTPGCRMPKFQIWDKQIEKYLHKESPIVCKRPLIYSNNHYLWIGLNRSEIIDAYKINDVDDMNCYYQAFYRKDDTTNDVQEDGIRYAIPYGEMIRVSDEFITVLCAIGEIEVYRDYHFFFPDSGNTNQINNNNNNGTMDSMATLTASATSSGASRSTTTTTVTATAGAHSANSMKINVMIIGLDSISRLNFHRQMNESANILLNHMRAIELYGYNKIADNTYPNLMPALAGLDEDEMQSACMPYKNETFDQCHFIWDDFKRRNYTTVFAEDMSWLGLFNYFRPGFKRSPTDFYFRPFIYEAETNIGTRKEGNAYMCLGGRRTINVLLDYVNKFLGYISETALPYFSFFWATAYTHDYFNYPAMIDKDFAEFLQTLGQSKEMENTFLLVMSDHGIRFGAFRNTYQGMMEERQPFLFIVPPVHFPDKYPLAMRNLITNQHALTTHFDFYELLRDLYDPQTLTTNAIKQRADELRETDPMPRGISLFLPIPATRSCYTAGISPHWCTCHERKIIPKNDRRVINAARKVVNVMNEKLEGFPMCHKLSLNSISDANLGVSNDAISNRNTTNNFSDISVRLQTKPGYGEFEATVRVHENGDLMLTGSISRTNMYGKQSNCIDDYHLKLYCFCGSYS